MDKYRIYCEAEGVWHEVIASASPTKCPVDAGHLVNLESAVIIEKDITALDGTPTEITLEDLKSIRFTEIDSRTGELIANGFEYPPASGKLFSLSTSAQINISALNQSRDELTYPINYNTIDDMDFYDVSDAADLHNMYLTALSVKKAHLDSGTALKAQVRAAVDDAGVNAVVDNR